MFTKKLIWLSFTTVVFLAFIFNEGDIFFFSALLALVTMPLGIVVFCLWWLGNVWIEGILGYEPDVEILEFVFLWLTYTAIGYVQLFKLIPYVKSKYAKT